MSSRIRASSTIAAAALLLGSAWFSACSTTAEMPPISISDQRIPGKVVWHDLLTDDLETASRFYSELFGWKFERLTDRYGQFTNGGRAIGGIAQVSAEKHQAYWMPLVSVPDVDKSLDQVKKSGGKSLKDPFTIPKRGKVAVAADPQGAAFAMITTDRGDPPDREASLGDFLWQEVWTADPDAAGAFYEKLAGYTEGKRDMAGKPYHFLQKEGKPRVGLIKKPDPSIRNSWVSYVRVEDPVAITARAEALGGRVIFAPREDIRKGTVAILADPTGGAFLIQKWPL